MPILKISGSRVGLLILALCWVGLLGSPIGKSQADELNRIGSPGGQVSLIVVPAGTTPADLEGLKGAGIGLMSPGLGDVSSSQTWLDVSQGSRVFDRAYDRSLDGVSQTDDRVFAWDIVERRAASVQPTIIPGLMGSRLARSGLQAVAARSAGEAALAVVRRDGRIRTAPTRCDTPGNAETTVSQASKDDSLACPDAMTVYSRSLPAAFQAVRDRKPGEMVILIESPPAGPGDQLTIAIAGDGFRGMLRSPSTRTDGYVLSTDIAPTVLRHFGLRTPNAMSGLPIEVGGKLDLEQLAELEGRYEEVGKRKGAALAIPLLLWMALTALAIAFDRSRAGPALRLLCLSTILLPVVLLATAAMSPSLALERGLATLMPVVIAALLIRFAPGWRSLAIACGMTVIPYGIDMLAGSALTPLAVIGPNPGLGARFYGIGNELESTLMILTSVGLGAALTVLGIEGRKAAVAFLAVGLVATVVFAAGRFGADVGAAIVFPVAAVVAAAISVGRPRLAWVGLAVAAVALVLLLMVDVITGNETHFVRSVLGGSNDGFVDVLKHRLDATGASFTRVSRLPITLVALALIAVAVWKRAVIRDWLSNLPMMRAGIVAAAAGSLIGAATNDSGALFLQVGVLYLGLALGFTWSVKRSRPESG